MNSHPRTLENETLFTLNCEGGGGKRIKASATICMFLYNFPKMNLKKEKF